MASNSPPFMPVTFKDTVPKGLWNVYTGPWEDGPGRFVHPANTGSPVMYAGQTQTAHINIANPLPPFCTLPGAAKGLSQIP